MKSLSPTDIELAMDLLDRAFHPSTYESKVTQEILADRQSPSHAFTLSEQGRLIGFILYSSVTHERVHVGWALAPVAVEPDVQGRGHGSRLIRESLAAAPLADAAVFVLGDPGFYERFGFVATPSVRCPFDESGEHFRVLRWSGPGAISLEYHPAFNTQTSEG